MATHHRFTKYRSETDIIDVAERLRALVKPHEAGGCVVQKALAYLTEKTLKGHCEPLRIKRLPNDNRRVAAKITRESFPSGAKATLEIQVAVLAGLEYGDPWCRFVVAHEIGHVILHSHYTHRFTEYSHNDGTFVRPEEDVECQADAFARHLLLPIDCIRPEDSPADVAAKFNAPLDACQSQVKYLEQKRNESIRRLPTCISCGKHTYLSRGIDEHCDDCIGSMLTA